MQITALYSGIRSSSVRSFCARVFRDSLIALLLHIMIKHSRRSIGRYKLHRDFCCKETQSQMEGADGEVSVGVWVEFRSLLSEYQSKY